MGFTNDFKSFALKGNVMDLAVGVIIGAEFGKIVTAVVEDIFMPVIGMVVPGGKMFVDQYVVIKAAKEGDVYHTLDEAKKAGANVFAYGHFIQTIFDFMIIALCVFVMIKALERMKRKQAEAPVAPVPPSTSEALLIEIRDELRKK